MLSATLEDAGKLTYPVLASPKLDGIRALVRNGVLVSRNLKPIPNRHCQAMFALPQYEGLDGELVVDEETAPDCFRTTTSGVMSVEGKPDVKFRVFDVAPSELLRGVEFEERLQWVYRTCRDTRPKAVAPVQPVAHELIGDAVQLEEYELKCLGEGYEGVMVRSPTGAYKYGRATAKEGTLFKVKRFADAEAVIVGFEEQQHNGNAATKDALGRTERSTHKAGKTGKGVLGAFLVEGVKSSPYAGKAFSVGTGFIDSERRGFWSNRARLLNQRIKFKYFPLGSKDLPRFPVFIGFRED
jgi:DNA ligase-1